MRAKQESWSARIGVVGLVLATCVLSGRAEAQVGPASVSDGQWHFVVAPYLWFTGMKGSVSVKGVAEIPIDKSFSDVIGDFHFGFQGHFEGRKNRFGLATDVIYIDLHVPVAAGRPVLGQLGLDTSVKQITVEGLGFYRLATGSRTDNPGSLDVLVGARYYDTTNQLNASFPSGVDVAGGKQSFGWVDALVGVRFRAPLGSRVSFIGRGDVAGFGSKVTWNVEGDLAARLSQHFAVGAGWRHMSIDYDKPGTDAKLFDLAYDGPRAWFSYGW